MSGAREACPCLLLSPTGPDHRPSLWKGSQGLWVGQRLLLPTPEFIAKRALKPQTWFCLYRKRGTTLYAAPCLDHRAHGTEKYSGAAGEGAGAGAMYLPCLQAGVRVECWTNYSWSPKDMVHNAPDASWLPYTPICCAGILPQLKLLVVHLGTMSSHQCLLSYTPWYWIYPGLRPLMTWWHGALKEKPSSCSRAATPGLL